jgi:hypothetical protein
VVSTDFPPPFCFFGGLNPLLFSNKSDVETLGCSFSEEVGLISFTEANSRLSARIADAGSYR